MRPNEVSVKVTRWKTSKKGKCRTKAPQLVFTVNRMGWAAKAFALYRKEYPKADTLHGKIIKPKM